MAAEESGSTHGRPRPREHRARRVPPDLSPRTPAPHASRVPPRRPLLALALACPFALACTRDGPEQRTADAPQYSPAAANFPAGPLGASVRRGEALVRHTTDSLPTYAPGRVACASCHLDAGRDTAASPLTTAWTRYPRYLPRTGAVVTMTDRVNYCFTRSLAGRRLPAESREMADILAYLAWLAHGLPVEPADRTPRDPAARTLVGDSARGYALYSTYCAACHGPDGAGRGPPGSGGIPALWGRTSYAIGASMAREARAATFIQHNMPLGRPNTLTAQQAFDVAAYVNAHPRPDSPGKGDDWPTSTASSIPYDVPYATHSGHAAYRPPPLLPRHDSATTVVPPPPRAP